MILKKKELKLFNSIREILVLLWARNLLSIHRLINSLVNLIKCSGLLKRTQVKHFKCVPSRFLKFALQRLFWNHSYLLLSYESRLLLLDEHPKRQVRCGGFCICCKTFVGLCTAHLPN